VNKYKKQNIGALLIIIIFGFIFYQKATYDNEIESNKELTIGVITNYQFSNYAYSLSYEYMVNEKKYQKIISTSFFKCKDGSKGCVGKKFPVYYSKNDPTKSKIDLGKFNKFISY